MASNDSSPNFSEDYKTGLKIRREVLGDVYVDHALTRGSDSVRSHIPPFPPSYPRPDPPSSPLPSKIISTPAYGPPGNDLVYLGNNAP